MTTDQNPAENEAIEPIKVEETAPVATETSEMLAKEVEAPAPEKEVSYPLFDFAVATKENFQTYFGKIKDIVSEHAHPGTYKKVDEITKEVKEAWSQLKQAEKQAAIEAATTHDQLDALL